MAAIAFWSTHVAAPSKQLAVSQDSPPGKARSDRSGELEWTRVELGTLYFWWNCPIPLHLTWRLHYHLIHLGVMCEAAYQPCFHYGSIGSIGSSPEDPQSRTWLPDQPHYGFNGGISKSYKVYWFLAHKMTIRIDTAATLKVAKCQASSMASVKAHFLLWACTTFIPRRRALKSEGSGPTKTLDDTWRRNKYKLLLQVQDQIDIWKLHSEENLLDKLEKVINTDISSSGWNLV